VSELRFVADENLNERLVVALQRRVPGLDLLRVRDARRIGRSDADLLDWAAAEGRVLMTHDARTVPPAALTRVREGTAMPGVIVIDDRAAARVTIDDLALLVELATAEDLRDRIVFVPLQG
jgi:hypothetical protein